MVTIAASINAYLDLVISNCARIAIKIDLDLNSNVYKGILKVKMKAVPEIQKY